MLATAHRVLGRKVDVVGMDACLMTMIEVAYQLRDHAQVLVGSEETEPGPGWPHAAILGDLTARPAMTAGELGGTVVTRYVASYRHSGQIATQSAIDLGQLGDLVEAVDILAHRLLDDLKRDGLVDAIRHARARTLQFFDGLYLDLHHLAGNLAKAVGPGPIADACIADPARARRRGGPEPDHRRGVRGRADGAGARAVDLLPGAARADRALPGSGVREADAVGGLPRRAGRAVTGAQGNVMGRRRWRRR